MQMNWVAEHPDAPIWMHVMVNLGVVFMSIILAWGLLKAYDLPVRKWLTENWLKRSASPNDGGEGLVFKLFPVKHQRIICTIHNYSVFFASN